MLLVIALGLTALAVGGVILHRRYHRRRRNQWTAAPGSQPNINEWGPGQSVHDLGWAAGQHEKGRAAGRREEMVRTATKEGKGKGGSPLAKGGVTGMQPPKKSYGGGGGEKRGHRFSGRFF